MCRAHVSPLHIPLLKLKDSYILQCIKFVTPARRPPPKRMQNMVKMIAEKVSAWRRYRSSVRELSRLTDRELNDLGLNRYDIEWVARKSAGF